MITASTLIMPTPANAEDVRLELLRNAPLDSWIALSEDETRIVAVGTSYQEAVQESEKAGVSDPLLIKTPKVWIPISV
jgi:hypothetical protein